MLVRTILVSRQWLQITTGAEHVADADLWLSPRCRLLADSPGAMDFVYDGAGHRLVLPEGLAEGEALPLILIGAGKSLLLRNVICLILCDLHSELTVCHSCPAGDPQHVRKDAAHAPDREPSRLTACVCIFPGTGRGPGRCHCRTRNPGT